MMSEHSIYGRGIPKKLELGKGCNETDKYKGDLQPITVAELGLLLQHQVHARGGVIPSRMQGTRDHAARFGSLDPERTIETRRVLTEAPECGPLGAVERVLLANLGALSAPEVFELAPSVRDYGERRRRLREKEGGPSAVQADDDMCPLLALIDTARGRSADVVGTARLPAP